MGPVFVAFGWLVIAGAVFVPVSIIAFVMLRSIPRAFVLGAAFTVGVIGGAFAAALAYAAFVGLFLDVPPQDTDAAEIFIGLVLAGAIGGGTLALYLLGRLSKYPPWRRY